MATPLNPNDTIASGSPTQVATINPGDRLASSVQYYKYADSPVYQNSLYSLNAPQSTVNTSAIPADSLGNTQAIRVPMPDTDTSGADGMVEGAKSALDYFNESEKPETETSKKYNDILGGIEELLPGLGNKQSDQLKTEESLGIPDLKKSLADVNALITTRLAQYEKQIQSAETASGETPLPIVLGRQAVIRRNEASDIGLLQARALGLQGQVQAAQDTANRAIDLKYGAMEDQINVKMQQLQLIQPLLDSEEKRWADALNKKYQDDQQKILDQKQKEKDISSIMMEAAKFGANGDILDAIQGSQTLGEAIGKASPYLGAPFAEQLRQTRFENGIRVQELNLSRARLALEQQPGADLAGMMAYAQQYASTGKIPTGLPKGTFGIIANLAKDLPKQNGTIVDRTTGTKPDVADTLLDGYAKLYSVVELAKQLKELDAKRPRGITGGLMSWANESDSRRYIQLKDQIVDLLSRARSGAALTVTEEARYSGMLPARFSNPFGIGGNTQGSIDNFIKNITGDLNNKLSTQGLAIYGLSTVDVQGKSYKVGDLISNGEQTARVNPDGSLTLVDQ